MISLYSGGFWGVLCGEVHWPGEKRERGIKKIEREKGGEFKEKRRLSEKNAFVFICPLSFFDKDSS